MTITVSITEYRNRIDEILDAVIKGEETVVVTFSDGRNFVLVPGSEWQSMDETAYLTSTAANRAALAQSLKEAQEGRGRVLTVRFTESAARDYEYIGSRPNIRYILPLGPSILGPARSKLH